MFQENIIGLQDRLEVLVDRAVNLISEQLTEGNTLIIAWSGGKDSSATLNLVLQACVAYVAAGFGAPRIIITHADPGVENPAVVMQARADMRSINAFAEEHSLDVVIKVSHPTLNNTFAVKVFGGRDLPVYSGVQAGRKCSQDWKIKPMEKMTKGIVKEIKAMGKQPVTVLGTRFDESSGRKARMKGRGETADSVWASDKGELRLSPIADWSVEVLWQYLHGCASGKFASYSDFSGIIELYRDGSDPEDVKVVDGVEIYACRFGCAVCTAGKDKSMAWMLKNNPEKWGWMEPLQKFQKFLLAIQHGLDRRNWVCFDLKAGYAVLRPNTLSPSCMEELLRMAMTLDFWEDLNTNGNPRFRLVPDDALVLIDATWSLQGHHKPYHALRVMRDVWHYGKFMDIPEIEAYPQQKVGSSRYFYINEDYDSPRYRYTGLDLMELDLNAFDSDSRCIDSKLLPDGRRILDVPTTPDLTVNMEGIYFMLDHELDDILDGCRANARRGSAFRNYYMMGAVSLARGPHTSTIDRILRRTMWKEDVGLAGLDPRTQPEKLQEMLDKAISQKEFDAVMKARKAELGAHEELVEDEPAAEIVPTGTTGQFFLPGIAA